jgi:hypothetical protein
VLGAFARHAAEAAAAARSAHNSAARSEWGTIGGLMVGFGLRDADAYVRRAALAVLDEYSEAELWAVSASAGADKPAQPIADGPLSADSGFATALLAAAAAVLRDADWEVKLRLLRLLSRAALEPQQPTLTRAIAHTDCAFSASPGLTRVCPNGQPPLHAAAGPVAERVRQLCAELSRDADPVVREYPDRPCGT